MEPWRRSVQRSIAYHRAVAAKLVDQPQLLARARARAAALRAEASP